MCRCVYMDIFVKITNVCICKNKCVCVCVCVSWYIVYICMYVDNINVRMCFPTCIGLLVCAFVRIYMSLYPWIAYIFVHPCPFICNCLSICLSWRSPCRYIFVLKDQEFLTQVIFIMSIIYQIWKISHYMNIKRSFPFSPSLVRCLF